MKKQFTLLLFLALLFTLCLNTTFSQQSIGENNSAGICGRPKVESYDIQEIIDNTKRMNPDLYWKAINKQSNDLIQTDTVGMIRSFYAINDTSGTIVFYEVKAKLMKKGNLVQIWADTTELNNNHVTDAKINSLLSALEDKTPAGSKDSSKGIVELLMENFGSPPNKDGDNKIDFLLLDIINKKNSNAFTLGYFFSYDQTDGSFSNKRDILYIDTNPTTIQQALSTLAHELQHLIHYNYDKTETTFLNEGLSLYSEVFCGYPLRSPSLYFQNTNRSLFSWDRNNSLPDYSRAGIFTQYYMEQLKNKKPKIVVEDKSHADTSLSKIFQQWKGYKFNTLFSNWAIANYANSQNYDSSFGYVHAIPGKPKLKSIFDEPNLTRANLPLKNYSIEYHKLHSLNDSVHISLNGNNIFGKVVGYPKSSPTYYDSIRTDQEYEISSFSLTTDSVICVVINFGNKNEIYDLTVESGDDKTYWEWTEWKSSLAYLTYDSNKRIYGVSFPGGGLHYANYPDYKFNNIYSDSFDVQTRPVFPDSNTIIIGTQSDGVWRSTDKGDTWNHLGLDEEINFNSVTGVAVNNAGDIYASSYRFNYLFYKTTDQGTTWQNIDNNILNTHTKRGYNIVVDRLNNVFAFTDFNEIYFSKDKGNNWTLIDDTWDRFSNIAKLDPDNSLVAYSSANGLFVKDFFTEEVKTFGLPKYWSYNDVSFHPDNDSLIYVSVSGPQERRGVYKSIDKGNSWQKINSGLEELPVISLAVDNKGMAIATTNNAIHKIDSSQITSVETRNDKLPSNFYLSQNYPNPFNPSTKIEYYLAEPVDVKLTVYNVLGQKVRQLVEGIENAGNYNVTFNAEYLSSGVYFYRLQAGEFIQTKKMLLLR